MSEITLVHEDIYVYVDKISLKNETKTGTTTCTLTNNTKGMVADGGVIEISIDSGSYTSTKLTCNGRTITINKKLIVGSTLIIDLNKFIGRLGNDIVLLNNYITLKDNSTSNDITVTLTGSGSFTCSYNRNQVVKNNNDLYFCENIDISTGYDHVITTNVQGKNKLIKTAKKNHSWSINGLWNGDELKKFVSDSKEFCLRIVDIDNNVLETVSNCTISSIGKSSSSDSDYTYSISGSCLEIF